jgi:hypothetical protein
MKPTMNHFSSTNSNHKVSVRERAHTQVTTDAKHSSHTYILTFKREIVMSYLLSTGYVGIYEPNYKLLFNKS